LQEDMNPPHITLISPGANGTGHALRVDGNMALTAGESARIVAAGSLAIPATVKSFNGIEFWIRSDGSHDYRFTLINDATKDETTPEITLTPSSKWESVRIPAPPVPAAAPADQSTHMKLAITPLGKAGEFSMEIDEIKTY